METQKYYLDRQNYRFLPADQRIADDSMIFELDESEVWNSAAVSLSQEFRTKIRRASRKPASSAPFSMPVNVPDWSKILKEEYRENRQYDGDCDGDGDDYGEEKGDWIPPHEFLARARIASSVHEGIGRTLKGRDMSRLRNAIWQKTGFLD